MKFHRAGRKPNLQLIPCKIAQPTRYKSVSQFGNPHMTCKNFQPIQLPGQDNNAVREDNKWGGSVGSVLKYQRNGLNGEKKGSAWTEPPR